MNVNKKTIEDINVSRKRVLVRCDFNVPLDENGNITNDNRIRAALPTIQYLIDHKARVILCSHLGRPKGVDKKFSLSPVAKRLEDILGIDVPLAEDVVGISAKTLAEGLKDGDVMMIENVRFEPGETKNDPELAKQYASLADIYVNDAFGSAHRAHASTEGVAHLLPAVAGYLIGKELSVMGRALEDPERPFVAILGGAKVSDKIGVIKNLLGKVNTLLIGGGMAYTFIKANGGTVGNSLLEEDKVELAKDLMQQAKDKGVTLLLPLDNVIAKEFKNDAESKVVGAGAIPDGWEGLDIGPKTQEAFRDEILKAGTVIWNGPMGVFEFDNFAVGTRAVAQACADSKATTIIGGGDSAAAVMKMGFADKVSHISTGGGASLEFLEGIELPGVAALNDATEY